MSIKAGVELECGTWDELQAINAVGKMDSCPFTGSCLRHQNTENCQAIESIEDAEAVSRKRDWISGDEVIAY